VEPQLASLGCHFPRLSTLRYEPKWSAEAHEHRIIFYAHENPHGHPAIREVAPLILDWVIFWAFIYTRIALQLPRGLWKVLQTIRR
jgi:hypothetical protein